MRKLLLLGVLATSLIAGGVAGAKTVTVTITPNGYVPNSVTIDAGDTVQFINSDTVAHQVAFKSVAGVTCTRNPLVLQPGQTASCTFRTAGKYDYSDPNVRGNTFRGTVTVGPGQPPGALSVALSARPLVVVYGGVTALTGSISTKKQGEAVQIFAQRCGQAAATTIGTVTTATAGAFAFQTKPLDRTIYTARAKNATSNAVTVNVRPRLRLAKLAPSRYRVRVFAATSFAGKVAIFQRYNAALRRWVKVKLVVLRPSTAGIAPTVVSVSTFRARIKPRVRVRVVLPRTQTGPCYVAGRSNAIYR